MAEYDIIHGLPALKWKDEPLYCSSLETSWSHMLVKRHLLDVDGDMHDWTKRNSFRVTAVLEFKNAIEPGLYPGRWNKIRPMLLRGEIGDLSHPDLGIFPARVGEGSYKLAPAESTSGVSVTVTWEESLRDDAKAIKFSAGDGGAAAAAAQVDEAMAAMGLEYPDGSYAPSFAEMLDDINNFGPSLAFEFSNKVATTVALVDKMATTANAAAKFEQTLAPPDMAIAYHVLRPQLDIGLALLRTALVQMAIAKEKLGVPTAFYTTTEDTTLPGVSFAIPAEVTSLIKLNPQVLVMPLIPKGTKLKYAKAA